MKQTAALVALVGLASAASIPRALPKDSDLVARSGTHGADLVAQLSHQKREPKKAGGGSKAPAQTNNNGGGAGQATQDAAVDFGVGVTSGIVADQINNAINGQPQKRAPKKAGSASSGSKAPVSQNNGGGGQTAKDAAVDFGVGVTSGIVADQISNAINGQPQKRNPKKGGSGGSSKAPAQTNNNGGGAGQAAQDAAVDFGVGVTSGIVADQISNAIGGQPQRRDPKKGGSSGGSKTPTQNNGGGAGQTVTDAAVDFGAGVTGGIISDQITQQINARDIWQRDPKKGGSSGGSKAPTQNNGGGAGQTAKDTAIDFGVGVAEGVVTDQITQQINARDIWQRAPKKGGSSGGSKAPTQNNGGGAGQAVTDAAVDFGAGVTSGIISDQITQQINARDIWQRAPKKGGSSGGSKTPTQNNGGGAGQTAKDAAIDFGVGVAGGVVADQISNAINARSLIVRLAPVIPGVEGIPDFPMSDAVMQQIKRSLIVGAGEEGLEVTPEQAAEISKHPDQNYKILARDQVLDTRDPWVGALVRIGTQVLSGLNERDEAAAERRDPKFKGLGGLGGIAGDVAGQGLSFGLGARSEDTAEKRAPKFKGLGGLGGFAGDVAGQGLSFGLGARSEDEDRA